jgi:hypothetical protein
MENWTPKLGELCEMRPRPQDPPLIIPDVQRGGQWPPDWRLVRVDKYALARFKDGDAEARPRASSNPEKSDRPDTSDRSKPKKQPKPEEVNK